MSLELPTVDREAEQALLGAALGSVEDADEVLVTVGPADLYFPEHRLVLETISDLLEAGQTPDAVTVASELKARDKIERIGGSPYLVQLLHSPRLATVEQTAKRLLELALVRRAGEIFERLAQEARRPMEDRMAWLQKCEAAVYEATSDRSLEERPGALMSQVAEELIREISERSQHPELGGARTGFTDIDEHIGGMLGGEMWVVAGRPGAGKTSFVDQVAQHRATMGDLVIFFSLEMKRGELALRSTARRAHLPLRRLRKGEMAAEEWSEFTTAAREIGKLPMVIDDGEELTPSRLRSKIRRHVAMAKQAFPGVRLGLVAIDYLQLMLGDGKFGNRTEEVTAISRAIKRTAKRFDVPVMALSQLNRPAKGEKVKPPQLSDLRESGAIEQDADGVLFIHRDDLYKSDTETKTGDALAIVGKGRNVGTGTHHLKFEGRYTEFSNLNDPQVGMDDYYH